MSAVLQSDIFRDAPQTQARHWRDAAETALQDFHYSEDERKRRHAYYMRQAEKIETGNVR